MPPPLSPPKTSANFLMVQVAAENEKKAAADRDLAVKKAAYKTEVNAREATAAVAFEIEKARQGQTVSCGMSTVSKYSIM